MAKRAKSLFHGVLVVDKPTGPTSHDVVARMRRVFQTRGVGHCGTLDPMATGVLVVAVGEGTKLVRWLTSEDKTYSAQITLGAETDTLDADGQVTERKEVPAGLDQLKVSASIEKFIGPHMQVAPLYSAIKVDGERLYARVRRGEEVTAPSRPVCLHRAEVRAIDGHSIEVELESAKGFYVRSFARDLARSLGTVGHLTALRRIRSGLFDLSNAVDGSQLFGTIDDDIASSIREKLLPISEVCSRMAQVTLSEVGVQHARHGRPIPSSEFEGPPLPMASEGGETSPVALFDLTGEVVGVGRCEGQDIQIIRGIDTRP